MSELIVKRLVTGIVVVFLALTSVFFLANAVGDPARAALGPQASPEALEAWRRSEGYDRPVLERYQEYFFGTPERDRERLRSVATDGLIRGDLGRARDKQSVLSVIGTRLPRTLLLSGMALSFEIAFGLILGTLAALRRGTLLDTGFMGIAFLGISIPTFVSGPIFLLVFAFRLGWFPIGGYGLGFWDHVYHGLLPALTMAVIGAATYARVMRSEMIDTMQSDYIRTARAKGLHPFQVVVGHGVRNAMLPIVTLMGLSFPLLVSGAIITEQVYNWTGMGRLAIESISSQDDKVIMGVVLIAAVFVQIGNLLADIAVGILDPRVRLESKT
jgi:peptide/nickel transport system permease protein